jgi:hypothetical protein
MVNNGDIHVRMKETGMRLLKIIMLLSVLAALGYGCESDPDEWTHIGDNEAMQYFTNTDELVYSGTNGTSTNTTEHM